MAVTYLLILVLFILLGGFFTASEMAVISSNPYTLDSLEKKGSRRARVIKRFRSEIDHFLASIVIGNTLVIAASSVGAWAGDTLGNRLGVSLVSIGDFRLLAAIVGAWAGITLVSVVAVLGPTERRP